MKYFYSDVFSVFVLFVFMPLYDRVKDYIDKTFYRECYEFEKTLEQTIEARNSAKHLMRQIQRLSIYSLSRHIW